MGVSEDLRALREQLELKQKELDLILAIDRVRDTAPEPLAMLTAIANVLADHLQADLCLLCLLDSETGELELKAINDRSEHFEHLATSAGRILAKKAIEAEKIVVWSVEDVRAIAAPDLGAGLDELKLAAMPITMGPGEHLGAVVLARAKAQFSPADLKLLTSAESQIDSALVQIQAYYKLQQRNKELETIYRVDRIRDRHPTFDDMLNAVLQELRNVIRAEMGFIMLYNQSGHKLELRSATDDDLFRVASHYDVVNQIANESLKRARLICENHPGDGLQSVMCIPLILNSEIIGVLGVVNRYSRNGFNPDDRRLLSAIGSQMDTAIFESMEKRRLREVLARSVDQRVMERLLARRDVDFLKGERSELSVLYSDIRGSTRLAARTDPELFVGFINHYLGRMTEVILHHDGTLDKFVGDEVMALFSAPLPQPDHALRAVRVGLEMQRAHQEVVEIWRDRGIDAAPIGVGIATGELIVGEMGCPQRTDYTAIGQAANLGARICSIAKGGQVLISDQTYTLVRDWVTTRPIKGVRLKGVSHDVTVYQVIELSG
jgi:adenylate cyclase